MILRRLSTYSLRHALPLLIALSCVSVAAAPANKIYEGMLNDMRAEVQHAFILNQELPLDPDVRAAADELKRTHLARLDKLLRRWLDEEGARIGSLDQTGAAQELYASVLARLLNELALWQLDAGDAAYEAATLAVLKTSPGVCESTGTWGDSDFSRRVMRIQAMPAAQRDAALASEGQLLARWGEARPAPPPLPDPLPQDAVSALLKRWQDGGPRPALALPPALASELLSSRTAYASLSKDDQCAVQLWWLRLRLRQGVTPADALSVFRYATLNTLVDRYGESPAADERPESGRPVYPRLARRFGVTGATTVRVRLDGEGLPQQAAVVARKVIVPGIRDARPVAFEQIFDAAVLDFAMTKQVYKPVADGGNFTFKLVWNLNEQAKDGSAAKSRGGQP